MAKRLELTGEKYGRLTVIEFDSVKQNRSYWLCRCECGNVKSIQGKKLRSGHTKSCGCLVKETSIRNLSFIDPNNNGTHKKRYSRIYYIWCAVKRRCNSVNDSHYEYYGGRGIKVCDEWNNFQAFHDWAMDNGYDDSLTIERIDVNGNYEPSNCKWIPPKDQSNNKRNNILVKIEGETKTLGEWAEKENINYGTIKSRYYVGDRGKNLIRPVGQKRAE